MLRGGVQKEDAVPTLPAQEHAGVFLFDKNELCVGVCCKEGQWHPAVH